MATVDKNAKKAAQRAKINHNIDKHIGAEPKASDIKTVLDIRMAYNWYNYSCDQKDFVSWVLDYMKTSGNYKPEQISAYKTLPDWRTSTTAGAISRMLKNGVNIPEESIVWLNKKISDALKFVQTNKKSSVATKNDSTLAEKDSDKLDNIIGDIEQEFDNFYKNGYQSEFSMFDYLKTNSIKSAFVSKIIAFYMPLEAELSTAIAGGDPQVKEAYANIKMSDRRKSKAFLLKIITDCMAFTETKKSVRKPRKVKEKSAEKVVSKVTFMKESSVYKIASIDPTRIVKAQMLFTFNTKYKKLNVYYSADDKGLSVRGTTIINFDETKSISKTLRKPNEVLPLVLSLGKLAVMKNVNGIKTTNTVPNGRINQDTVLLRVIT